MQEMLRAALVALLSLTLLSACDCGQGKGGQDAGPPPDGGAVDAGAPDAGADGGETDGGLADGGESDGGLAANRPAGVGIVGGGGEASSADHRLRVTIGAPQPMGDSAGPAHAAEVGPETGP